MEKIIKFDDVDKCVIVSIPIGIYQRKNIIEATRRCWRANFKRAEKAKYVLGVVDGIVKCVIQTSGCDYVKEKLCQKEMEKCRVVFGVNTKLCKKHKRLVFEGIELKNDKKYLGKKIPDIYLPKQNPVRYTYE